MARILVIETDARQASLVKAIVLNHVGAELEIVRSKDQAIAAIGAEVPDLILLSALISPRDEQEVVAHLRTLDGVDHLQTLTIPRIASSSDTDGSDRGLLGKFKRRRGSQPRAAGCEPKVFADEILGYLERAEQIRADRAALAEAEQFAAEAEAERLRTGSGFQESPVSAGESVEVAAETEALVLRDQPLIAEVLHEPLLIEPPAEEVEPEIKALAEIAPEEPPAIEPPILEVEQAPPAVEAVQAAAEAVPDEPPVVEVPLLEIEPAVPAVEVIQAAMEMAPDEPPVVEVPLLEIEPAVPAVDETPMVAEAILEAVVHHAPDAVEPMAVPAPMPTAPLTLSLRSDYTPLSALAWTDQPSAAEDVHTLLHGLRLPESLADLARAGGCRIRRVRVGRHPGSATLSDRRADADDHALEPHPAWLDGRRGTAVASPQSRTPAGSR